MSKWSILTKEVLHSLFILRDDGALIWKEGRNRGYNAGSPDSGGYLQVDLRVKFNSSLCLVLAHQIVFMMEYGYVPEKVDHIDGNILNNTPSNLRAISTLNNVLNSKTPVTNTSGYKGVSYDASRSKWRGTFTYKGKRYMTTRTSTPEEAHNLLENKRREIIPDYDDIVKH